MPKCELKEHPDCPNDAVLEMHIYAFDPDPPLKLCKSCALDLFQMALLGADEEQFNGESKIKPR
jgi:hypothetical protein